MSWSLKSWLSCRLQFASSLCLISCKEAPLPNLCKYRFHHHHPINHHHHHDHGCPADYTLHHHQSHHHSNHCCCCTANKLHRPIFANIILIIIVIIINLKVNVHFLFAEVPRIVVVVVCIIALQACLNVVCKFSSGHFHQRSFHESVLYH